MTASLIGGPRGVTDCVCQCINTIQRIALYIIHVAYCHGNGHVPLVIQVNVPV